MEVKGNITYIGEIERKHSKNNMDYSYLIAYVIVGHHRRLSGDVGTADVNDIVKVTFYNKDAERAKQLLVLGSNVNVDIHLFATKYNASVKAFINLDNL